MFIYTYLKIEMILTFYFVSSLDIFIYLFIYQITFTILVKVLMSIDPGEDLYMLKREFEEFIKGLICLPIKFPGTRLYKSLKVIIFPTQN
jgi:3-epi-6-deoxocathasterone 23-monooxygenase